MEYHEPVLLEESIRALAIKPDGVYLDGTLGGGGHFEELVHNLSDKGTAVGIDRDPQAIDRCRARFGDAVPNVIIMQSRFSDFDVVLEKNGLSAIDGVILDLGVSSHQIDSCERGFSHATECALDMRMNPGDDESAAELLGRIDESELSDILAGYGEVANAPRMARALLSGSSRPRTSAELKELLEKEYGRVMQPKVLSRIFQALRIAVNGELSELERFLGKFERFLNADGRLVVISYHSLEDRMVKQFMAQAEKECVCPPRQPVCTCSKRPSMRRVGKKAVQPSLAEVQGNRRARSARMRVAEKVQQCS